jgi:hypothetical protein
MFVSVTPQNCITESDDLEDRLTTAHRPSVSVTRIQRTHSGAQLDSIPTPTTNAL